MDFSLLLVLAALAGGAFGLFADRLATRWPEHEEGVSRRGLDWRSVLLVLTGALVAAALFSRWSEPRDLLVLFIYCAALLLLLATDLDQRLLPFVITLPLIAFSAVVLLVGWSPLLADRSAALLSGLLAGLGAPLFLAVTDRLIGGALGGGDLFLAVSIGFMSGVTRFFSGFLVASVVIALVLIALIVVRRIGLRTAIPFGPMLIGAAYVAAISP
jgi:leader peptidase (prepilin peptidase)/N-methyltransferase